MQLQRSDFVGDASMKNVSGIWQNCSVEDKDNQTTQALFILSEPISETNSHIVATLFSERDSPLGKQYEHAWLPPMDVGIITITGVSGGPQGIVQFISSQGYRGSLDMAQGLWHCNE